MGFALPFVSFRSPALCSTARAHFPWVTTLRPCRLFFFLSLSIGTFCTQVAPFLLFSPFFFIFITITIIQSRNKVYTYAHDDVSVTPRRLFVFSDASSMSLPVCVCVCVCVPYTLGVARSLDNGGGDLPGSTQLLSERVLSICITRYTCIVWSTTCAQSARQLLSHHSKATQHPSSLSTPTELS